MSAVPTVEEIRKTEVFPLFVGSMRKILGELAGWPIERVDQKITSMLENDGFRMWFLHDSPAYFAAEELIPSHIDGGLEWVKLRSRIKSAIEGTGDSHRVFPHEDTCYDWDAARRRVSEILQQPNPN